MIDEKELIKQMETWKKGLVNLLQNNKYLTSHHVDYLFDNMIEFVKCIKKDDEAYVCEAKIKYLIGNWFCALEDSGVDPWTVEECVTAANEYHYTKEDYEEFLGKLT